MKKLLSLVLVLAVVLSSMSFAFAAAPSDLGDYKYADEVKRLVGLGIINGYPDGTFKPTGNITRAEFAKVVVTALGYSDAAVAASDAKFTDMAGHWAIGYVNVASSLGIINGVGGGKFAPDANVKYEEAVTMIVRALGYEPAAKSNGGYPNGYLAIASQKKITKDVAMVAGTVADRGTVAKVVAEALDKPFLKQTGYGTLTTFHEAVDANGDATESLLLSGLKLKKEIPEVDSFDTTAKTIKFKSDVDKKRTLPYVDPIDPTGTENCKVTVWYKDGTIYSFKNETTIKIDMLDKINDSDSDSATYTAAAINDITLKLDGGRYYEFDNSASVSQGIQTVKLNDDNLSTATALRHKLAKMYLKDNKVYRLEMFDFTNGVAQGIITAATDTKITYQKYDANNQSLMIDNAKDMLLVAIDGVQKTKADLKADMFFSAWYNDSLKKVVIAATTKKMTGKLEGFKKDKITVAGTEKDLAVTDSFDPATSVTGAKKYASNNNGTDFDKYSVEDLVGKDVVAYLDNEGKVAFVKGATTSSTSDFYGIVKRYFTNEKDNLVIIKDVDGKSTEVTYQLDLDGSPVAYNTAFKNAVDNASRTAVPLYKFSINGENKIKKITAPTVNGTYTAGQVTEFNKDNDYVKTTTAGPTIERYYASDAKFFSVAKNDLSYDPKVVYWKDIEGKGSTGIAMYFVNEGNQYGPKAAVINQGYDALSNTDKFYGYVSNSNKETSDDFKLTISGLSSTVLVDEDEVQNQKAALQKSIVSYVKDGEGRIKVKAVWNATYADNTGLTSSLTQESGFGLSTLGVASVYDIDGSWISLTSGGTKYKIASDVVVVRVSGDDRIVLSKDDIVDDLSDGTANGNGYFVEILYDAENAVKGIFFKTK